MLGVIASVCVLTGVMLAAGGCALDAKPATGQEVSPVQLHSRAQAPAPPEDFPTETSTTQAAAPSADRPHVRTIPSWAAALERTEPTATSQTEQAPVSQMTPPETAVPTEPTIPQESVETTEPVGVPEPVAQTETVPEIAPEPEAEPVVPSYRQLRIPALEEPGAADELVSVNFEDADIRTVLKTIGQVTGINFIFDETVAGRVSVMSPTPIRLGEIYPFLQTILDVYGFAAVESENAVKIVPKTEAAKSNTQVRIGADPANIPLTDAIVTQIMRLRYADAAEIGDMINPSLSTTAQMVVHAQTNSIMLTDTSANIHHIAQIIQLFDVESSRETHTTIPLQFASAQVLSEQINRILESSGTAVGQAGRARITTPGNRRMQVLPDERTNSIIAVANKRDLQTIRQLIQRLDVPRPAGADSLHVVYLEHADANELAPSLTNALNGLATILDTTQPPQITAHGSTNSLIVVASPQDYELVSRIIDRLDIPREQVVVQALIVEVTEEALQQIGVDWATLDDIVADSMRGFALTNFGPRVDFLNGNLEGLAVGAWRGTNADARIGFILQALETRTGANILSRPTVVTSNHRTANIVVGENIPFVIGSRITDTTDPATPTVIQEFEYKDVGITLQVTPNVNQGGMVTLDVKSEFTKLIEDAAATSLNTPVTAKRSADTMVTMKSGTTIIIGGLMRDDTTRVTQQIPILGDIPWVGSAFRTQRERKQKTNLLIFITPTVMANEAQMLDSTNQMRQEMLDAQEQGK